MTSGVLDARIRIVLVGISKLRDHLSKYLRAVRKGQAVTIVDRGHPVAHLVPHAETGQLRVRKHTVDVRSVKPSAVKFPRIDLDAILDDVRADRV